MQRLAPDVNRILYVRNLPYKISSEEMYEIFGGYGSIRQIRLGNTKTTRGSAFVVFDDIFDAKKAMEKLTGFKVGERYVVILYFKPSNVQRSIEVQKDKEVVEQLKRKHKVQL